MNNPVKCLENMVSKEEVREIHNAFNQGIRIFPNRRQKAVLKKNGLDYRHKPNSHGEIYVLENENLKITTAVTPGDWRTGRNTATKIIKLLRHYRAQPDQQKKQEEY
ncbi:MAG: hypothetical protein ABIE22_01580 [archaeon]